MRERVFPLVSLQYSLVALMIAAERITVVYGGPTKHSKSNPAEYKNDHLTKLDLPKKCKGGFILENLHIKFSTLVD